MGVTTKDNTRPHRPLISFVVTLVALSASCSLVYDRVGGAFLGSPSEMDEATRPGAKKLLRDAFDGVGPDGFVDYHVHMISREVHSDWLSWWHPIQRARTMIYLSAAGVELNDTVVRDYELRLLELIRHAPGKGTYHILAFDKNYGRDGEVNLDKTPLYVPNAYVMDLAQKHPDLFVPVISIHPYRADAIEELERWARKGCHHIKWLPNVMGIDPSSDQVEPFYRKMRDLDMILMTHTGNESALDVDSQHFGNPLLLRKPLQMGVRVVALHSGSDGLGTDLDSPTKEEVPNLDLFLRMLENPMYDGLLFGEISAMVFYRHVEGPLLRLLEREDLHHRFVNGSDYPVPGINAATRTSTLVDAGLITDEQRLYLNEIYSYNPLVFDFVVKRTLKHPETGRGLPVSMFRAPKELGGKLSGVSGQRSASEKKEEPLR
jgi:mannonate dehydratase